MSPPQIIMSSEEDISPQFLDEFQTALTRLGIPFETEQRERAVYMALEDHIPTVLVVFLAKPFFDGFLKKAGEDAYAGLKRGLASLVVKASSFTTTIIKSSAGKFQDCSSYSRIISIYSLTNSDKRLKFLLPAAASEEEALEIVDSILALLIEHSAHPGRDALSVTLATARADFLYVLEYDLHARKWRLYHPERRGSNRA